MRLYLNYHYLIFKGHYVIQRVDATENTASGIEARERRRKTVSSIVVEPLREDLPFGARIKGVTHETLKDEANRKLIKDTFIKSGVVVFEDVEQTPQMQVEISQVIGPLKDHPVASVERVDNEKYPGVIVIRADPKGAIVNVDGEKLVTWQPWHFDHCYNNELNYAGVLRSVQRPTDKGMTAFADGIQIYNDLPENVRAKIEDMNVIYTLDLLYSHMKYANTGFDVVQEGSKDILKAAAAIPRAIHPAVWKRDTGEKVFHLGPWMAWGVEGNETPEGDQFFEEVWDAALKVIKPYFHEWKGTEMVVWDNHRMLHRGTGSDPEQERVMHRTTIKGDYGHGRWEDAENPIVAEVAGME